MGTTEKVGWNGAFEVADGIVHPVEHQIEPARAHLCPLRLRAARDSARKVGVCGTALGGLSRTGETETANRLGFDTSRRRLPAKLDRPIRPLDQFGALTAGEAVQDISLADQGRHLRLTVGDDQVPRPGQPGLGLRRSAPHDGEVPEHRIAHRGFAQALDFGDVRRRTWHVARADECINGTYQPFAPEVRFDGQSARLGKQFPGFRPRTLGCPGGGQCIELIRQRRVG